MELSGHFLAQLQFWHFLKPFAALDRIFLVNLVAGRNLLHPVQWKLQLPHKKESSSHFVFTACDECSTTLAAEHALRALHAGLRQVLQVGQDGLVRGGEVHSKHLRLVSS